jgi:hypothetical protein
LKEKQLDVIADATLRDTILSTGVHADGLKAGFVLAGKPSSKVAEGMRALEAAGEGASSADSADGNVFSTRAT